MKGNLEFSKLSFFTFILPTNSPKIQVNYRNNEGKQANIIKYHYNFTYVSFVYNKYSLLFG